MKHNFIDELIISVIPVLLGNGTRLFAAGRPEETLELIATKTFDTGLAQLHYVNSSVAKLQGVTSKLTSP